MRIEFRVFANLLEQFFGRVNELVAEACALSIVPVAVRVNRLVLPAG
jgi:hypothetical protein